MTVKYENLMYAFLSISVIISAFMKIIHAPYAEIVFLSSFIGMALFQTWHIHHLKKEIEVLKND